MAPPPALSALQQLTHLSLSDNSRFSADASFDGLRQLTALHVLDLWRCSLANLPASLSALTLLERLQLSCTSGLVLTSQDVRSVLAHLPRLAALGLDDLPLDGVHPSAWAALARACPSLDLSGISP